jgi:hypothetical protein
MANNGAIRVMVLKFRCELLSSAALLTFGRYRKRFPIRPTAARSKCCKLLSAANLHARVMRQMSQRLPSASVTQLDRFLLVREFARSELPLTKKRDPQERLHVEISD